MVNVEIYNKEQGDETIYITLVKEGARIKVAQCDEDGELTGQPYIVTIDIGAKTVRLIDGSALEEIYDFEFERE